MLERGELAALDEAAQWRVGQILAGAKVPEDLAPEGEEAAVDPERLPRAGDPPHPPAVAPDHVKGHTRAHADEGGYRPRGPESADVRGQVQVGEAVGVVREELVVGDPRL